MTEQPQSWETQEEALAALHAYAQQYAEREEDEAKRDFFINGHQVLEVHQGSYVLALKPGQQPFTYA